MKCFGQDQIPSLNFFVTPIVFIVIGSYFIARLYFHNFYINHITFFRLSSFFSVYAMAVDTLFLCFLEDLERNNDKDKPYYMSKSLKKILDKMEKTAAEARINPPE